MLSRSIDSALDAIAACRSRTPALLGVFRAEAPERAAIERLLEALEAAHQALQPRARISPGSDRQSPVNPL